MKEIIELLNKKLTKTGEMPNGDNIYLITEKSVNKIKEQLNMYVVSDVLLSVPYLMGIHDNLPIKEALNLLKFCKDHTIKRKECYGRGKIMYHKWVAEKESYISKIK